MVVCVFLVRAPFKEKQGILDFFTNLCFSIYATTPMGINQSIATQTLFPVFTSVQLKSTDTFVEELTNIHPSASHDKIFETATKLTQLKLHVQK
jgi:hypothetical protein